MVVGRLVAWTLGGFWFAQLHSAVRKTRQALLERRNSKRMLTRFNIAYRSAAALTCCAGSNRAAPKNKRRHRKNCESHIFVSIFFPAFFGPNLALRAKDPLASKLRKMSKVRTPITHHRRAKHLGKSQPRLLWHVLLRFYFLPPNPYYFARALIVAIAFVSATPGAG